MTRALNEYLRHLEGGDVAGEAQQEWLDHLWQAMTPEERLLAQKAHEEAE